MSRETAIPTRLLAPREVSDPHAHARSLINLRYSHEDALETWVTIECPAKTWIRLRGRAGWSESSLGSTCNFVVNVVSRLFFFHAAIIWLFRAFATGWDNYNIMFYILLTFKLFENVLPSCFSERCIYIYQEWLDGNCEHSTLYFICKRQG